ncbi:MAG: purine-nucleoside phosphorylase [Chloroflexi bacterium]|nr:purine-nucleoside phosphorylase [Chloroflexota bacterium]
MAGGRSLLDAAVEAVRSRRALAPAVGLVLGSGLGDLAREVVDAIRVPYGEIPGFPKVGVAGHAGVLSLGTLEGAPVAVMEGRPHFYECGQMAQVAFPIRLLHALGCEALIVTNAAGGLNPDLRPGDLMLIADHICWPALVGGSPLMEEVDGGGFVDMAGAYDAGLRSIAGRVAEEHGVAFRQGVYAQVGGPQYETPAEVRLLRAAGADAVGMSTAAEVIVARQLGMRVLGVSCITNAAGHAGGVSHAEVLERGHAAAERLCVVIRGVVAALVRGERCDG